MRLEEPLIDLRAARRETVMIAVIGAVVVAVAVVDPSPFAIAVAVVAGVAAGAVAVAALPSALRLTIDGDGFELRLVSVYRRRIPWSAVGAIEIAEGWSGPCVAVELRGPGGEGTIPGLPVDPTLGRRAFASSFGLEPEALRDLLLAARAAAYP